MSSRPRALGVAVLLALALLFATRQITPTGWYAEHGAYRAQVDAFLAGRLALSEAPDALAHDLAWANGVQQVWGLGVPMWQTPFELVGRALGVSPFPDRVALLAWFVLVGFVVLRAFGRGPRIVAIGSVLATLLLPAFVTMLRSRIEVYEEAAAYAYGAALILLGGMVCFARKPTLARYWLLVSAAGLTGFLRPTVWFYGLATALIVTGIWWKHRRGWRSIAVAAVLFVAGGAALYATNARRFGAGSEFGHRLNVEALPGNIVATRFGYPFEHAGIVEAGEELLGSLFDRPELRSKRGFYQSHLHHGQSDLPRWREYYFTTFSWSYLPILLAGLLLGALAWRGDGVQIDNERKNCGDGVQIDKLPDKTGRPPDTSLSIWTPSPGLSGGRTPAHLVWAWALLGLAPLFVFYLHTPSVSSRYQLDLAPGFAALIVIAWDAAARRFRAGVALGVLAAAWLIANATAEATRPHLGSAPFGREAAAAVMWPLSRPLASAHVLPAVYDLADPLLPVWTEAQAPFDRCADEAGTAISCDSPPIAGDVHLHGRRGDRRWVVSTSNVVDEEPVCVRDDAQVCRKAATIADAPDVVRGGLALSQDTLYDNATGWDLVTGVVPSATFVYVQDPQFVEVDVDRGVPIEDWRVDWSHAVRAVIGLHQLQLVSIALTGHGARLRFEAMPGEPLPSGFEVVFLAFGEDRDLELTPSAYSLRRIRVR